MHYHTFTLQGSLVDRAYLLDIGISNSPSGTTRGYLILGIVSS